VTEPDNKNLSEESIEDKVSSSAVQAAPKLTPLFTTKKVRKSKARKLPAEVLEGEEPAGGSKNVRKYIKSGSKQANGASKAAKKAQAEQAKEGQKLDAFFHLRLQAKSGATLPIPEGAAKEDMEVEGLESENALNQTMEEKKISLQQRSPLKPKPVSAPEQPLDPMVSSQLSTPRSRLSSCAERSLSFSVSLFSRRE